MGRSFAPAVISSSAPASESIKAVCPYPKWSAGLFDPDSDEFFMDAIDERRLDQEIVPAPLSPVDTDSTSSTSSGRVSPANADADADAELPSDALRRVRADVDSLTWLARVPADAHNVSDARELQADTPDSDSPRAARTRSISNGADLRRRGRDVAQLSPALSADAHPPDVLDLVIDITGDDRPARPITPPHEMLHYPSTPPRSFATSAFHTPATESYALSPPPSVTPRVLAYEHASRRAYPPAPPSPTLSRAPRRMPLPAF